MSLGSSTGSMVDAGSDIVDAIKRARAKEFLFLSQQEIVIHSEMVIQNH